MAFEKFTVKAVEAIAESQRIAGRMGNPEIRPGHLLLSLLVQDKGIVPRVLQRIGVDPGALQEGAAQVVDGYSKVSGEHKARVSKELQKALDAAEAASKRYKDTHVASEMLLLGLEKTRSKTRELLHSHGVTADRITSAIEAIRGGPHQEQPGADRRARRRQDRHRRGASPSASPPATCPSPQRQAGPVPRPGRAGRRRQVPRRVRGAPQGGAQGDRAADGEIICSSTSSTPSSARARPRAMDAGNMLKPALARGELRCIGATTLDEYRKHIEKDKALERRFQPVFVDEPSVEATIAILRGIKEKYEVHHGVRITDDAVVAAATLSDRYISDRSCPTRPST